MAFGDDNTYAKKMAEMLEAMMSGAPAPTDLSPCDCGNCADLTEQLGEKVVNAAAALVSGRYTNLGLVPGIYRGKTTVGVVVAIDPIDGGVAMIPIAVIINNELLDDIVVDGTIRVNMEK
jgi:hypothetical protein